MVSYAAVSRADKVFAAPSNFYRETWVGVMKPPKRADVEVKAKPVEGPFPGQNGGA